MTDGQQRCIFVIDDEEPIRKVLQTHLMKEGYRVVPSSGGREVFDQLKNNSFELLICDIMMPGVDGLEILNHVRSNYDITPVIMLTGLTDISVAVDVMKKGAFDYVMKPVKKHDLLESVRRAFVHRD